MRMIPIPRPFKELLRALAILAIFMAPGAAFAGSATLRWTAPTTCADLSSLVNCPTTAFEVQMATAEAGPFTSITTAAPSISTYVVQDLPPGPRWFRVLTVSNTLKSTPSAVVTKVIEGTAPNPPNPVTIE